MVQKVLILLILLSACSPHKRVQRHIERAAHHLKRAQELDPNTVMKEKDTVEVIVPEVRVDTVFKSIQGDTVRIERDRLKIKYVKLPGDSVFIDGKCEADTVYKEIEVPVYIQSPEWSYKDWIKKTLGLTEFLFWIIHILGGLVLLLLLVGRILR